MRPICRPKKELHAFPEAYTVLDLETTGVQFQTDYIIEFAAIRVRKHKAVRQLSLLLRPPVPIPPAITALTGITDEMAASAPVFEDAAPQIMDFLGNDILVGHSIDFDITFLWSFLSQYLNGKAPQSNPESACSFSFSNEYVDTLPLSRRVLPELIHHRLSDLAAYYGYDTHGAHRALFDCFMTYHVLEAMKETVTRSFESATQFFQQWDSLPARLKADSIIPAKGKSDSSHPFYQKQVCITGVLSHMSRREAMQRIADTGGINTDKLNTSTDFLIAGNNDYCPSLKGVTGKYKKALRLAKEGYPVRIITEEEFYLLYQV